MAMMSTERYWLPEEVAEVVASCIDPEMFRQRYSDDPRASLGRD